MRLTIPASKRRCTRREPWWRRCLARRPSADPAPFVAALVVAAMMAGACADAAQTTHVSSKARSSTRTNVVTGRASVVDGDGLEINGTKIRLFGIDAPEIDQYCQRSDGTRWRCGHYASVELDRLVAGHEVSCSVRAVDQYERSVAVCRVGEIDLAALQVRNGWAVAYRKFSKDYVNEEDAAHRTKRGLWAGNFDMPWAWRARTSRRR
jgi:endonuclease YncB( thermonuclease family)